MMLQTADTEAKRREHPRYTRRIDVELGPNVRAQTLDISAGGFSASLLNHFKPGQVIKGSLIHAGRRLSFEAQVRWSAESTRFGARFLTVDRNLAEFAEDITAN